MNKFVYKKSVKAMFFWYHASSRWANSSLHKRSVETWFSFVASSRQDNSAHNVGRDDVGWREKARANKVEARSFSGMGSRYEKRTKDVRKRKRRRGMRLSRIDERSIHSLFGICYL